MTIKAVDGEPATGQSCKNAANHGRRPNIHVLMNSDPDIDSGAEEMAHNTVLVLMAYKHKSRRMSQVGGEKFAKT